MQHGGTLEYGEAADQVAAEASMVPPAAKKARGGGGARQCGNCRETGHNMRSCKKAIEILSESEAST
jgi:hypothetical protein